MYKKFAFFSFFFIVLMITSCPRPMDINLQYRVEDLTAPTITILTPEEGSSYASSVLVEGIVTDNSTVEGNPGRVDSLSYEVLGTGQTSDIEMRADGTFSFSFPSTSFSGSIFIKITAEDWNGNVSDITLTLTDGGAIPGFTATASDGAITLSWDDVALSESYTVFYETGNMTPNAKLSPSIQNVRSPYVIENVVNGEMYSYLLQAHSSSGEDNWSSIRKAIPLSSKQLSPIVRSESDHIALNWENLPSSNQYIVLKSYDKNGPFNNISGVISDSRYEDYSVNSGDSFYYAVQLAHYNDNPSDANEGTMPYFQAFSERRVSNSCDTPGTVQGIAVSGNYIYVADLSGGLRIIDITNPDSPREIGSAATGDNARNVSIQGNYAYVAASGAGVEVFDISNPREPVKVSILNAVSANDVIASGDFAYIATESADALKIFDISKPLSPVPLANSISLNDDAEGLYKVGDIIYIAARSQGLVTVNVFDPVNPVQLDFEPGNISTAKRVSVSGPYAYVVDNQFTGSSNYGLSIFNVSNPSAITLQGEYDTSGYAYAVAIDGSLAFIADYNSGIKVISLADPASPALLTQFNAKGLKLVDIKIQGSHIFIADGEYGISSLDITSPSSAEIIYQMDNGYPGNKIEIDGDFAYLASGTQGFRVFDISNPDFPDSVYSYKPPGTQVISVAQNGENAFIADFNAGFHVFDISNPLSISEMGSWGIDTFDIRNIYVRGIYAFLATNDKRLRILDISDGEAPELLGIYDADNYIQDIRISGDYAYLAMYNTGLVILDISKPEWPRKIGDFPLAGGSNGLCLDDDFAYIADGSEGLKIISIQNPYTPSLISSLSGYTAAQKLDKSGSYLYMADSSDGLIIIDISDPLNPAEIRAVPGAFNDVKIQGRYAYLAQINNGLTVIDLKP